MFDSATAARSPLVIGLSGHRNLHSGCEAHLVEQVRIFLDHLRQRMPQTEIRIMTGMAQGADLLVADLALRAGLQVDAVLPMPLDQYLSDFDAGSASGLKSLLGNSNVRCVELTLPAPHAGAAQGAIDRDAHYSNLTDVLIDKCSLLLALWDGQSSSLPGGTADTVLRYLSARTQNGQHEQQIVMVPAGVEPIWGQHFVYWIPTSRTSDASPTQDAASYLTCIGENMLAVHPTMPAELDHQLGQLNAYNAEFEKLNDQGYIGSMDSLMATLPASTDLSADAELRLVDAEYARADALAIYNQERSNRVFRASSFMAFVMASVFLVYAKLLPGSSVLLSAYLAILILGLSAFYVIRGRHWFAKHLIYRVVAETMRTKFFLRLVDTDRKVDAAELMHLCGVTQFSGYGWIGAILKNVHPLNAPRPAAPAQEAARLQFVHQHWIRGQQAYFKSKVQKLERTHHRLAIMKRSLICTIVLLALVLLLFAGRLKAVHIGTGSLKDIAVFLMGLLPVWLGIWELYQNKMATRELLWQYRNQLSHFSRADLQLTRNRAHVRDKAILIEVGKESLMESYLWTIHRFHREHEPPAAS